jgi:hypothetical protein
VLGGVLGLKSFIEIAGSPSLSRKKPIVFSVAFNVAATRSTDALLILSSAGKVARKTSMLLNLRSSSSFSKLVVAVSRTFDVAAAAYRKGFKHKSLVLYKPKVLVNASKKRS